MTYAEQIAFDIRDLVFSVNEALAAAKEEGLKVRLRLADDAFGQCSSVIVESISREEIL